MPCPSITDSTPHLEPRFTGLGALLAQERRLGLQRMVRWQEAPGYMRHADRHGKQQACLLTHQTPRMGQPFFRVPETWKAQCLSSRAHSLDKQITSSNWGTTVCPELGKAPYGLLGRWAGFPSTVMWRRAGQQQTEGTQVQQHWEWRARHGLVWPEHKV